MIKNYPENTHFHYDIFASKVSPGLGVTSFRISKNFHTYVVLKKLNSGSQLEAKLPDFARKYAEPQFRELLGASYGDLLKSGNIYEFSMQPLTIIHLNSHPDYEREPDSDIKYIYIFSIISVFLLLKACIKFMKLSTDYDFVQTMKLRPADGRYFSCDYPSDSFAIKFVTDKPFGYFFLNDYFNKLYKTEQKKGQIITVFSVLAIFIACLGLFGLAAFAAERRTREMGIRKVPGASITGIVILLSKEFTKWVLAADLITWPLTFYFMNDCLENFACRITPGPSIFLYSAVSALFIALVIVSLQAVKVAAANPVNSLISE